MLYDPKNKYFHTLPPEPKIIWVKHKSFTSYKHSSQTYFNLETENWKPFFEPNPVREQRLSPSDNFSYLTLIASSHLNLFWTLQKRVWSSLKLTFSLSLSRLLKHFYDYSGLYKGTGLLALLSALALAKNHIADHLD